ncbi:hypothetical protein KC338_g113 [Hortaea werneckii]|nr:hypothetical protein KC338_g113 [Hortaea werneckii]
MDDESVRLAASKTATLASVWESGLYALNSEKATAQQKVDALRAALLLSAQALACLFAVTVVWRLGAAVLQILGVLLWPLITMLGSVACMPEI